MLLAGRQALFTFFYTPVNRFNFVVLILHKDCFIQHISNMTSQNGNN